MIGCKVVLRNEMISYSCFATLMRRFKNKRFINTRTIQLARMA
nr:MAG TPA: ribosomal L5P family protein [Caudoviricetes sp.]